MSNTLDDTLFVPRHKFSIGGRNLFCFLLVLFLLVSQDALALRVGDRVVVQNTGSDGLRIRSGAGTGYAEIGKVYDGDKGTIVSGPTGNVYTWWRVNWDSSSKPTGWSAERNYQDGTVWLARDASAVKPSISSVGNASATEGNTLRFTVRLSASTSQTETYYYSTFYGGGATAERGDYDGEAEESIRVSSGRSSFTVRIDTNEDADFDDETFYLYVTGEANHPNTTPGSSNNRGTGTIRDDDEPVTKPSISSVGDASATEGNTLSFTVRLSTSTSQTETYYYSTFYGGGATAERGDYDGEAEESIRVSSGRSSFTVRIDTNEDADFDDEIFYLYVTGEANHPSTTPGSSKYRGTGTIRDDDSPTTISRISIGDAEATEGNAITFTVTLTPAPTSSVTYYYATYQGTARNTAQKKDYDGKFATALTFNSGETSKTIQIATTEDTEVESDEQFSIYITDAASKHPASGTPTDYLATAIGTIRDDDSSTTPVTPPNPSVPSGTHKYTFSLDNKTYTVASDNCYSPNLRTSAKREYIDGLRIYNSSNELVRPTNDILFQLTAAHASACMLDGIKFSNIDEGIKLAQERSTQLRGATTEGKKTSQITAGIVAAITVISTAAIIVSTGGLATPLVFGVLALAATGTGLFVVAENKEDLAIVVADLFLTSKRGLEQAKELSREIENYDLTGTINVNDLNSKMYNLDVIIDNITFAQQWLSDGRDLAIALYPALEGSTWNKRSETILVYLGTPSIALADVLIQSGLGTLLITAGDLGQAINIRRVASKLDEHLKDIHNHNIADVKSPFKTLEKYKSNIYGYALVGTRNADIMRNFASGAELSGGNGNDWMYSEQVVTVMSGEGGNDYLFGGPENDVLIGGSGNDELKGGGGQDVAGFSGNRANYDIRWDSAGEWLAVSSSADGSDRVYRDIESLYFRDGTLATSDIEAPSRNLAPFLAGKIEDQVAFAGERFEYYIPANIFVDPDGDALAWRVSGLPSWLSFNSNTRLLSGTPTVNDVGHGTITVRVRGSSDSETFTLSVIKPNSPPVMTVPNAPYVVDGDGDWTSLSGLSVSDADNDELIVVVGVKYGQLKATGTMVADLDVSSDDLLSDAVGFRRSSPGRINSALATLEYRPANDWESGRDVLILLVGDAIVETPVLGFTSIYADTKPVFSGKVSNQTYTVGTEISTLTLPAATGGQAPLTYSLTPTVPGLTFTASTRTLSGTPMIADTHAMIYKVTDASSSTDTETFTITVEETGNAADFNGDGRVDINDYLLFFAHYTLSQGDAGYDARYDLDGNGIIGVMDFLIFVNNYGEASS